MENRGNIRNIRWGFSRAAEVFMIPVFGMMKPAAQKQTGAETLETRKSESDLAF
jgi:hypothetical protein